MTLTNKNIDESLFEEMLVEKKKIDSKKMTKSEYDRKIADWQLFYLNNLDIFIEEYLEIPLHHFQRQICLKIWENDITDIIASRGLSKSWTIGAISISLALLLPQVNIGISALTLGQSNKIITEKIDRSLSDLKTGISPILRQLRQEGYIKFKKDESGGDGKVVDLGNNSKIFAICCGEGGRSNRTNISILDEARLVKRRDYEAIVEPTLEPYNYNGLFMEPKQILMTSARTKDNWMWTHLKKTVHGHYCDKRVKYGFFAGDIFTAVANKVQTKKQYITRKEGTNDLDFEMEFLNLWLGESENSLFLLEDFHKNQVLENPFYIRNAFDYLEGVEIKYDFDKENEIRYLSMDIAVSGGRDNDNTIYELGFINTETEERELEYITSRNGLNSLTQVVLLKRLFYEYKCKYAVIDTKGVGNVFYDIMTVETYDEERDVTYPAWTVCRDKKLQIVSDNVLNDKIDRTISKDGEQVIIPFVGTGEINSDAHLAMRKNLKDGKIKFLKDDAEMELIIEEKNPKWITLTAEQKAEELLPFLETRYTINEAVGLNAEIKANTVKVTEDRSATKDRYMTTAMFNYFGDKLINKYKQDDQEDTDFDEDEWSFLGEICKI